jgi:Cu(I)/Ag(I) efflux system protein CusF
MKRIFAAIVATCIAIGAAPALADKEHAKHQAGAAGMVDGEIRKVDKNTKKLTIKHGPMPSLDMPAMTMVFQVKDPAMLDKVKAGDKVKFQAEKLSGAFTVTGIEPVK